MNSAVSVWLYIKAFSREDWEKSACPSLVAPYAPRWNEKLLVSGMLLEFQTLEGALKAALQCQAELQRIFSKERAPALVIDLSVDHTRLGTLEHALKPGQIGLTRDVARLLPKQKLETERGPIVSLENGSLIHTTLLLPSQANIAWSATLMEDKMPADAPEVSNAPELLKTARSPWGFWLSSLVAGFVLIGMYRFSIRSLPKPISRTEHLPNYEGGNPG